MFIDYITLMLVNMSAGLTVLGLYLLRRPDAEAGKPWAPAFAASGLVALATGLHMTLTWPIPNPGKVNLTWANVAFGEMTILLGVLLLGAAWSVARGWSLKPLSILGAFAAVAAIVLGAQIRMLGLTKSPMLTCAGFLLTGAGGLLVAPALWFPPCAKPARWASGILLLAAAAVWAVVGFGAYWAHLAHFSAAK